MKINNCRGNLSDISAKKEALERFPGSRAEDRSAARHTARAANGRAPWPAIHITLWSTCSTARILSVRRKEMKTGRVVLTEFVNGEEAYAAQIFRMYTGSYASSCRATVSNVF